MNFSTNDIWQNFSQELHRFITRRVSDPQDVEDILQDAFVKIHTHIGTLRDDERLAPWLYQVTRNTLTDYYRRRRPQSELPETYPAEGSKVTLDDDLAPELAASLRSMILSLPDRYRLAVDLAEIQGMKQQDVARQLGLSLSGAKSRVQRGRNLLRQELLDCCHFDFDQRNHPIAYTPRPDCCQVCCKNSTTHV